MECVLLQESKPDHTCDLKHQLLVIWEHITSDQLYDLIQTIFHGKQI